MIDVKYFSDLKGDLNDAPKEIKESYNSLVQYFAIDKDQGVRGINALRRMNAFIYNSNLKVSIVPGDTGWFNAMYVELLKFFPKDNWTQCMHAAKVCKTDEKDQIGLACILAIRCYNGASIGGVKATRMVNILSKAKDGDKTAMYRPTMSTRDIVVNVIDYIKLADSVKDATLDKYYAAMLRLNDLDDENSIVTTDVTNVLALEIKEKSKTVIQLEKEVDWSETNQVPQNEEFLSGFTNPKLIVNFYMNKLSSGAFTNKDVVKSLSRISITNPYFNVPAFEDYVYGELYVIIPLKEFIALLNSK